MLISLYNNPEYGNAVIEHVERLFLSRIGKVHIVPFPKNTLADENHHFGLHPLHFTTNYYEYLAECVKEISVQGYYAEKIISLLNKREKENELLLRYCNHYDE